jgi:hypothetical protein
MIDCFLVCTIWDSSDKGHQPMEWKALWRASLVGPGIEGLVFLSVATALGPA